MEVKPGLWETEYELPLVTALPIFVKYILVYCRYVYNFGCPDWLIFLSRIYLMTILRYVVISFMN